MVSSSSSDVESPSATIMGASLPIAFVKTSPISEKIPATSGTREQSVDMVLEPDLPVYIPDAPVYILDLPLFIMDLSVTMGAGVGVIFFKFCLLFGDVARKFSAALSTTSCCGIAPKDGPGGILPLSFWRALRIASRRTSSLPSLLSNKLSAVTAPLRGGSNRNGADCCVLSGAGAFRFLAPKPKHEEQLPAAGAARCLLASGEAFLFAGGAS